MAGGMADTSTIDLGEDLNCAICMQILFQPLTLLDCMHTFCGACLKDWFAHQAASARSIHPYTCPSCRDSVRSTKRYPFIMNMLEKHLAKNPDKVRSEEDKQEHTEKYKPGDNVLPKLRLREPPPDPEDERVMSEVMQRSLQEAGITSGTTLEPPSTRRPGDGRGSSSRTSSRSPGRPADRTRPVAASAERRAGAQGPLIPQTQADARQIQHQSSLISLLSVSEMDPGEMQEEITRMIAEEGLLDDVDLTNLDSTREEELSERIAAAYRRRKEEARRRRQQQAEPRRDRSRNRDRSSQRASTSRPASRSGAEDTTNRVGAGERRRPTDARPPVSNPQLIDSANQSQTRHRRSGSSTSTRPNIRTDSGLPALSPTLAPILPSASVGENRPRRSTERSATDPTRMAAAAQSQTPGSAPSTPRIGEPTLMPPRTHSRQRSDSNPQRSPRLSAALTFPRTSHNHSTSSLPLGSGPTAGEIVMPPRPLTSATIPQSEITDPLRTSTHTRPKLYTEPIIQCSDCCKNHIEYEVHYSCGFCAQGGQPYTLCKSCYRKGKAHTHQLKLRNGHGLQDPGALDKPHVFAGERLSRPKHQLVPSSTLDPQQQQLTDEDPAARFEKGVFCDLCSEYANNCYWKCDACNDGDWGYCNNCVMKEKHCPHPLQALKAIDDGQDHMSALISEVDGLLAAPERPKAEQQPSPPSTPKTASIIDGPVVIPLANLLFKPLTFHTLCDICTKPIPPSVTRYHCPQCNNGDYDICMSCYHGLVAAGKISQANGPQGWRKCLQGHRMVVIGFQDTAGGQRRLIDREVVGGWTFVEDDTRSSASRKWRWKGEDGQEQAIDPQYRTRGHSHTVRLPPDGGIGLVFYGKWNYFPDDATEKDLCFPKGAEIREAEDINGEWLWGYYAGRTGLFPAVYVDFLRKITM